MIQSEVTFTGLTWVPELCPAWCLEHRVLAFVLTTVPLHFRNGYSVTNVPQGDTAGACLGTDMNMMASDSTVHVSFST